MDYYSSKRYRKSCCQWLGAFVFIMAVCVFTGFLAEQPGLMALIAFIISGPLFLGIFFYHLVCGIRYTKAAQAAEHHSGVIENWEMGLLRGSAQLIVRHEGRKFPTPAFFSTREAPDFVGRRVTCFVINETVFLCNVL